MARALENRICHMLLKPFVNAIPLFRNGLVLSKLVLEMIRRVFDIWIVYITNLNSNISATKHAISLVYMFRIRTLLKIKDHLSPYNNYMHRQVCDVLFWRTCMHTRHSSFYRADLFSRYEAMLNHFQWSPIERHLSKLQNGHHVIYWVPFFKSWKATRAASQLTSST